MPIRSTKFHQNRLSCFYLTDLIWSTFAFVLPRSVKMLISFRRVCWIASRPLSSVAVRPLGFAFTLNESINKRNHSYLFLPQRVVTSACICSYRVAVARTVLVWSLVVKFTYRNSDPGSGIVMKTIVILFHVIIPNWNRIPIGYVYPTWRNIATCSVNAVAGYM
jgi:hypothetical protein